MAADNAPTESASSTLEATTKWLRSIGRDADRCLCCDGPHVFAYQLVELDPPPPYGPAEHFNHASDWLHEAVMRAPEGARLRITVEVIS